MTDNHFRRLYGNIGVQISDNSIFPELVIEIRNVGSVSSNWSSRNVKGHDKKSSNPDSSNSSNLFLEDSTLKNRHTLVIGNLSISSISNKFNNSKLIMQG